MVDLQGIKERHLLAVDNLAKSLPVIDVNQVRRFVNLDCGEMIAEVERLRELLSETTVWISEHPTNIDGRE